MTGLGAILTAIVTPFDEQLRVDEEAFTTLHQYLCEHGSDGIVAMGTTGEAPTLTDDEHLRVIEIACANRPEGTTVIAGTGSNDTRHACHLTERATELGADAVLVVTPYYNRPNRRGIVRHYAEVSRATDKPIVLYNIPGRTGTDMPNDLLAELAQIDNIAAVKQANPASLALVDGLELLRRRRRQPRCARSTWAAPAGSASRATSSATACGRWSTSRRAAARSTPSCSRCSRRSSITTNPHPDQGGAEHARPSRRRAAAAARRSHGDGARRDPRAASQCRRPA